MMALSWVDAEHVVRRGALPRVGPGPVDTGIELDAGAEQHLEAHRARDVRGPRQAAGVGNRERGDPGHHLRTVHQREALAGLEPDGLEPRRAQSAPRRSCGVP